MARINILTKEIYNKIAAGEVVEKPASVVKELVENSIDAGATNITIEILNGGIDKIKVSDNGCGIDYDDIDKVFLAHATSKVKSLEDLSNIGTLGFRGEALSAIASVSNITLASKTEDSNEGFQVKVIGGEIEDITPIGATTGTYIQVEDLFFNIPARKKFLRKPKLEENDITNFISRLILAHPEISFKYMADNKIIYQSFGTNLYDAIYTVYGKSIVDNIFEVDFGRGDFKFHGYLGKPTFSKPNRTYQTLIINGRYVINQTISTSVYKAYENFIMKGTFPFFVLNLTIPLDKVDVNVHPNKLEVKFEDANNLFGIVYSEIADILYSLNNIKKVSVEEDYSVDTSKLTTIDSGIGSKFEDNNTITSNESSEIIEDTPIKEVSLTSAVEYEVNKSNEEVDQFKQNVLSSQNHILKSSIIRDDAFDFKIQQSEQDINTVEIDDNHESLKIDNDNLLSNIGTMQTNFLSENISIIGTIFNTYILIEKDNELLIIDQHAGHERILFDKFSNELNNKQVALQQLIVPYVLETNYHESVFINENIDVIRELGFEIDEFGDNSFKISTTPLLFDNVNLSHFFDELLSDIDNKAILSKQNTLREYLAKKACKSAVKGNRLLSKNEIYELVNTINKEGKTLLCPHGRPIVINLSKSDIEKWFKRIV